MVALQYFNQNNSQLLEIKLNGKSLYLFFSGFFVKSEHFLATKLKLSTQSRWCQCHHVCVDLFSSSCVWERKIVISAIVPLPMASVHS